MENTNKDGLMKTYGSKKMVDVVEFIKNLQTKHPKMTIHVGTDSQYFNGISHYVTVVALRFGNKGVIGLYKAYNCGQFGQKIDTIKPVSKKKRKYLKKRAKKDRPAIEFRLRYETQLSIEVAEYLRISNIPISTIDLDYNTNDGGRDVNSNKSVNISHDVLKECVGMCKGFGYEATAKPNEQVATPFADKLCRKYL